MRVLAKKMGTTIGVCEEFLDATTETIVETVAAGEDVRVLGFGVFSMKETPARPGRNPRTGEEVMIEARKRPVFKPGQNFKNTVKG